MIYLLTYILSFTLQVNPYCKVFGSMYEVEEAYQADFIVYEELSEVSADLVVYEQPNRLYADKPGMWYFEEKRDFAKHKVYFTDKKRDAHFSAYFTKFEFFAGCSQ
jgi:hypothetical protein